MKRYIYGLMFCHSVYCYDTLCPTNYYHLIFAMSLTDVYWLKYLFYFYNKRGNLRTTSFTCFVVAFCHLLVELPADRGRTERTSHHQIQRLHRSNGSWAVWPTCWQAVAQAHSERQGLFWYLAADSITIDMQGQLLQRHKVNTTFDIKLYNISIVAHMSCSYTADIGLYVYFIQM